MEGLLKITEAATVGRRKAEIVFERRDGGSSSREAQLAVDRRRCSTGLCAARSEEIARLIPAFSKSPAWFPRGSSERSADCSRQLLAMRSIQRPALSYSASLPAYAMSPAINNAVAVPWTMFGLGYLFAVFDQLLLNGLAAWHHFQAGRNGYPKDEQI